MHNGNKTQNVFSIQNPELEVRSNFPPLHLFQGFVSRNISLFFVFFLFCTYLFSSASCPTPPDFVVSEDAGFEPRNVALLCIGSQTLSLFIHILKKATKTLFA
jgi:hypothetical protein